MASGVGYRLKVIPAWVLCAALFLLSYLFPALVRAQKTDRVWLADPHPPVIVDDLDVPSLQLALQRSIDYLRRLPAARRLPFGDRQVTVGTVYETLAAFQTLLVRASTPQAMQAALAETFEVYQAAGRDGRGRVLFTGYFNITVEGRLQPSATFSYPIYRPPPDLRHPYFTRREIDLEGKLRGRRLELAWLRDPVEGFFLHVQGSGQVRLANGKMMYVGYAASNGRPYRSIGRLLVKEGRLDSATLSLQRLRRYFRDHPDERRRVLNANPRYIFFQPNVQGPQGSIRIPLVPGRSIATDARLFPPAALALIRTYKPAFDARGEIVGWRPFVRFVFNHDTGNAIRGAGRVDLFWGSGARAEMAAGQMRHSGQLFFLLKRRTAQAK
jgi:membrane-bound lytic murein transglycosylase A